MKRNILTCSLLLFCLFSFSQQRLIEPVSLSDIQPQGWLHTMLVNQERNFTGKLDQIGFPFTEGGWGTTPFLRTKDGVTSGFWVPYEQTAYYYDGMFRCGVLLKSDSLIDKSRKAIYRAIDNASPEGIMESVMSQGDMCRWPHAVFFRAMMAEYEETHNPDILTALDRHYRNDTLRYQGRDICNIEIIAWLYRVTKDKYYHDKLLSFSYAFTHSEDATENILSRIGGDERVEVHAVTYHELLKLPVFFYELTGDKKYLQLVRDGFTRIDKHHMLPTGIASGEEGLSGKTSLNTYEMCNVVDYMWTCSYMFRATKETEWADRIEHALFNAGMGGITKDFDAHQYYSCPNQVVCSEYSSIVSTYSGSRLAYRQIHRPPCCTGNLNRMFPIYVGSQWMQDKNSLYKVLYGPGEVKCNWGNNEIVLQEESQYPFGDEIRIKVIEGEAKFALYLRIPEWSWQPTVKLNGKVLRNVEPSGFCVIERDFKKGDIIVLNFPKKASYKRWDNEAMVVNYGPLLFALPVKSNTEWLDILTPKLQKESYKGYTMIAASDWNYILGVADDEDTTLKVLESPVKTNNPWTEMPIRIRVPAFKDSSWKMNYKKVSLPSGDELFAPITPDIPPRGSMIYALNGIKPEVIELIPYGSTLLRISMFPFWKQGDIPAEVMATENKY